MPNLGLHADTAKAALREVSLWLEKMSIYKLKWMVSMIAFCKKKAPPCVIKAVLFVLQTCCFICCATFDLLLHADLGAFRAMCYESVVILCLGSSASVSDRVLVCLFFSPSSKINRRYVIAFLSRLSMKVSLNNASMKPEGIRVHSQLPSPRLPT